MNKLEAKQQFVSLLQKAYSGELAAAMAYNGHWKSISDADDIKEIQRIEQEELDHRQRIGEMLEELGARPQAWRDRSLRVVGFFVAAGCHLSGWYLPMTIAAKLEEHNVGEYDNAAELSIQSGYEHFVNDLKAMSVAEEEHEVYFKSKARSHWMDQLSHNLFHAL